MCAHRHPPPKGPSVPDSWASGRAPTPARPALPGRAEHGCDRTLSREIPARALLAARSMPEEASPRPGGPRPDLRPDRSSPGPLPMRALVGRRTRRGMTLSPLLLNPGDRRTGIQILSRCSRRRPRWPSCASSIRTASSSPEQRWRSSRSSPRASDGSKYL